MSNPDAASDSVGEYFEIWNPGPGKVPVSRLRFVDDGADSFALTEGGDLAPGEYLVLGRTLAETGGHVDHAYGSAMTLANTEDEIVVTMDGVELDRVAYGPAFPLAAGAATVLDRNHTTEAENDDERNWCNSQRSLTNGDRGSPGLENRHCSE